MGRDIRRGGWNIRGREEWDNELLSPTLIPFTIDPGLGSTPECRHEVDRPSVFDLREKEIPTSWSILSETLRPGLPSYTSRRTRPRVPYRINPDVLGSFDRRGGRGRNLLCTFPETTGYDHRNYRSERVTFRERDRYKRQRGDTERDTGGTVRERGRGRKKRGQRETGRGRGRWKETRSSRHIDSVKRTSF